MGKMKQNICLKKTEEALSENGIQANVGLLVAVSGGADSVALLHLLLRLHPGKLSVCHVQHGIRGEQAEKDMAFVQALSKKWGLAFFGHEANVPAIAKEKGMTMEEAARFVRYSLLEQTRAACGAELIVTAHHMDDQAETVLMHLLRGSGLSGLCGMRVKSGRLFRPLLHCAKEELMEYVAQEGLGFCTDETNASLLYTRNKIRHSLIPVLLEYNAAISKTLANTAGLLQEEEAYLEQLAEQALNAAETGVAHRYDRAKLASLEKPLKSRALRMALLRAEALYSVSQAGIERLCGLLELQTGARAPLKNGFLARISYEYLWIGQETGGKLQPVEIPFQLEGETKTPWGSFLAQSAASLKKDGGPFVAYMDQDKLPKEITVRTRRPGDLFFPLGAPGKRKLKSYLIDKKIPREERDFPLIASNAEVLFFPGGTVSERVCVTEDTKQILCVLFSKNVSTEKE